MRIPKYKEPEKDFYVYDIETSTKVEMVQVERIKKGVKKIITEERRHQIPEGLGFMKVETGKECKKGHVVKCTGENCIEKMLDKILIKEKDTSNTIKIFAHILFFLLYKH